jgi:hypothetical protein
MIIEQQQVDSKFGEFVRVLKEKKFSFTPRRKREVTRKEEVFFSSDFKVLFYSVTCRDLCISTCNVGF